MQLVQAIKDIRAKAVAVVKEMSTGLAKLGEEIATIESRKIITDACSTVTASPEVSRDR
jgi:hypothetical protein